MPECMCTGWKNPNLLAEAKIKEAMANNQPVPQLERKTSCRDCGHEITDHGNLLSLVMPELKRRVILALKINNMMQVRDRDLSREIGLLTEQLNRVPPPPQPQGQPALNPNAMGMQMAQQGGMPPVMSGGMPMGGGMGGGMQMGGGMGGGMQMGGMGGRPPHMGGGMPPGAMGMPQDGSGMQGMGPNPTAAHYNQTPTSPPGGYFPGQDSGGPPFEKPVISQIMRNYVNAYKLIPKISEVQKQNIERISLLLINAIDNHQLRPPQDDDPPHDPQYDPMLAYQRWLAYCDPTKIGKYKTSEVFGFHMLRAVFAQVKNSFVQSSMGHKEIQSLLPSFVRNLEKELHKDVSSILDEGLLQRFEQYRNRYRQQQQQGLMGQMPGGMQQHPMMGQQSPTGMMPQSPVGFAGSQLQSPSQPSAEASGQVKKKRKHKEEPSVGLKKKIKIEPVVPPDDGDTTPGAWIISNVPNEKEPGLLYWGRSRISLGPEKKEDEKDGEGRGRGGKGKAKTAATTAIKEEEDRKEEPKPQTATFEFRVVANDNIRQHMFYLVDLKNIFSRQLPKMPREYISRLVFDKNHRSLVCLRDGKVIGGICFRPFPENGFLEIAFLAVSVDFQIRGIGRHVLNHLKEFAKTQQLYYFLTYADNYAIGFFKKLGFTEEITLDKKRWVGVIKDYDAGTPMECVISPLIRYLDLPVIIKRQREVVQSAIKSISSLYEVVRPGLNFQRKLKRIKIQDIPGMKESTWRATATPQQEEENIEYLHEVLKQQLKSIQAHASAWPFLKPVSRKEAPHYHEIIKDPIDLETMEKRLAAGQYYITQDIFIADLRRMFANCRTYNAPETVYYKCADQLDKYVDELFHLPPAKKRPVD